MNVKMQKQAILDELNRLKTSENILKEFQDFFALADNQLVHTIDNQVVLDSFYNTLQEINDKYIYDTQHLKQSNLENDEKMQLEKKQLRETYIHDLKGLDKEYIDQKKRIEKKYLEDKQQLLDDIKSYENEKHKEDDFILKQIQQIKKTYELQVKEIETTTNQEILDTKSDYDSKIQVIQDDINAQNDLHKQAYQKLLDHRDKESKSHDNDYIVIKSHYNVLNKSLNNQINILKQKKINVLASLDKKHESLITPLDKRITELSKQSEKMKLERINKRDLEIKHLNEKKTLETIKFEEKRRKIIAQSAESVSILNSKLSNYRELTNDKKRKIVRDFQTKSMSSKHETLQKNRELTQLDNDLNQFILRTRKEIKQKKSEGQLLLFELEKNHQILIADIEFLIKKEIYLSQYDLKLIDITLKHDQDKIKDQKQRLIQDKDFYKTMVEAAHSKDVYQYETQMTLATQTQERDLGQLVLDANVEITYLDKDLLDDQSNHDKKILQLQHDIEFLQFQLEKDIAHIQLQQSQALDKASRTRDLDLEECQLRLELKQETFDEQTALYKHQLDTLLIHYQKDIYQHESKYEYQKETLKASFDYKLSKKDLLLSEYEQRVVLRNFQMDFNRSENVLDAHVNMFNNWIQHILKRRFDDGDIILKGIQLLEYTFQYHEHPETMRQMIDLIKSYTENITEKQRQFVEIIQKTYQEMYENHFNNAKNVVLNMHKKDEYRNQDRDIQKLTQDKNNFIKKRYEYEVLMKQSNASQDEQQLKRIEKLYAKVSQDIDLIDQLILSRSSNSDENILRFEQKFHVFLNKKFVYHQNIIKKLEKSDSIFSDFQSFSMQQLQKLSQTMYYTQQVIFNMTKSIKKHYHKFVVQQQQLLPKIYEELIDYRNNVIVVINQEKQTKTHQLETLIHDIEFKQSQLLHGFEDEQNVLRRTFRESLVAKKNDTQQQLSMNHRSFQELKDKRYKTIVKLETQLQQFSHKKTLTLETLDVNHKAINEQEQQKILYQEQGLLLKQQKLVDQLDQNVIKQQHAFDEKINHSLQLIEQRLVKYLATVSKLRENFKEKMIDKTLHENKLRYNHKKRIMASKQKTSRLIAAQKKEKRLHVLHVEKHEKREQSVLNKKHQSIEFWVKKAYQFKIKSLDFS